MEIIFEILSLSQNFFDWLSLTVQSTHFGLSSVATESERVNVCLNKIVIHCGAWAENVRSSLFEGCVASRIFSYPFFFFNVLSNGQLLILMYKLQLTTPAVNSANQTPQLYRQTPAGVWSRWIWGCMGVCAVFSAGCTIAPRGSLVSIQVEFYEYLVSRWDPDHPPRTHQYA